MINKIIRSTQFKKDYKKAIKQGCKESDFREVLEYLVNMKPLPDKYRDHSLNDSKYFRNARECHIYPDWLLVYRMQDKELILELLRTGSHSDLFK